MLGSDKNLKLHGLTRVKKKHYRVQFNVAYLVHHGFNQVYTGWTKQSLEMRLKEHQEVCKWKMTEKLTTVAEHALENCHW